MADTELTQWLVAAETKEWIGPITVAVDAVPVTTFEVSLTAPGARPATWVSPSVLNGARGVLAGLGTTFPFTAGAKYGVWIRFTSNPEVPVQKIGEVKAY